MKRSLVEAPELWRWSSFRAYAYQEPGLVGERLERARAEAQKGDNFSPVIIFTRVSKKRETRGTRKYLIRQTKNHVRETWATRPRPGAPANTGFAQRKNHVR